MRTRRMSIILVNDVAKFFSPEINASSYWFIDFTLMHCSPSKKTPFSGSSLIYY